MHFLTGKGESGHVHLNYTRDKSFAVLCRTVVLHGI